MPIIGNLVTGCLVGEQRICDYLALASADSLLSSTYDVQPRYTDRVVNLLWSIPCVILNKARPGAHEVSVSLLICWYEHPKAANDNLTCSASPRWVGRASLKRVVQSRSTGLHAECESSNAHIHVKALATSGLIGDRIMWDQGWRLIVSCGGHDDETSLGLVDLLLAICGMQRGGDLFRQLREVLAGCSWTIDGVEEEEERLVFLGQTIHQDVALNTLEVEGGS